MSDDEPKLDSRHKFYSAIGHCISQWANIDETLFQIFELALRPRDEEAAIIYYNLSTIGARKHLTNLIVLSRLPLAPKGKHKRPGEAAWQEIMSKFDTLVRIRNLMAHEPTVGVENMNVVIGVSITREAWHEVRTSRFKPTTTTISLKFSDLERHYKEVLDLLVQMRAFKDDLLQTLP